MILSSMFGMPWFYIRHWIFEYGGPDSVIDSIPTFVSYFFKIIIIIFLISDFKKENLKNLVLTCIAAFFYPLLGVTIFAILMIQKERSSAGVQQ